MSNGYMAWLEKTALQWPNVQRRETRTQVVLSTNDKNFCWLSYGSGMVQIWPPIGRNSTTRYIDRKNDIVQIMKRGTNQVDAIYKDKNRCLCERFSYPGFMTKNVVKEEALSLLKQAYDQVTSITGNTLTRAKEARKESKNMLPKEEIKRLYIQLLNDYHNKHQGDLLPLESQLPFNLRYDQRDEYRTTITMILSEGTSDWDLSNSLKSFFSRYPSFGDLQNIHTRQELEAVLVAYGFNTKDYAGHHNVDRMWHLIDIHRNRFDNAHLSIFISELPLAGYGHGYGEKMVRALKAYVLGQQNLLPLDTPGFEVLKQHGFNSSINHCREQIEDNLSTDSDVILIDFHELLRFNGQTELKGIKPGSQKYDKIIRGWNAWRRLCAK